MEVCQMLKKKYCRVIAAICCGVLLCFIASILVTKYIAYRYYCEYDDFHPVKKHQASDRTKRSTSNDIPAAKTQADGRIGAQLSLNLTLLRESPPMLSWSQKGASNYLKGLNHVTHYFANRPFDCLEVSKDGRYLITIQLTYRYTKTKPKRAIKSYFTLTKFKNNQVFVVAKYSHMVPSPKYRMASVVTQPVTMVRSDPFQSGDHICVIVSHPALIYASKIDNFYGVIYL